MYRRALASSQSSAPSACRFAFYFFRSPPYLRSPSLIMRASRHRFLQTAAKTTSATTRRSLMYTSLPRCSLAMADDHDDASPFWSISRRYFSKKTTPPTNGDDDNDDNEPNIQTINADHLSEEDIARILQQEEIKLEQQKARKKGQRRPLISSFDLQDFEDEENQVQKWTLRDKRCGVLAIKVGMVPVYDQEAWGVRYPCTVLMVDTNTVVGHKLPEKHGYSALQIGAGHRKRKNVGKSVLGQYRHIFLNVHNNNGVVAAAETNAEEEEEEGESNLKEKTQNPPYLMREFRVNPECSLPIGSRIHASHFVPGQNVDVSGTCSGKGFQGGMKRHGFGGMPASHGTSLSHRAIGSTGACQDPGKVWKGKKMPGRMGGTRVTCQNLRIIKIDRGRNLIYVQGAVPGKCGNFVEVRDAVKKPLWNTSLVLNGPRELGRPPIPTQTYDEIDGSGRGGFEVFMPLPETDPLAADEEAA